MNLIDALISLHKAVGSIEKDYTINDGTTSWEYGDLLKKLYDIEKKCRDSPEIAGKFIVLEKGDFFAVAKVEEGIPLYWIEWKDEKGGEKGGESNGC